MKRMEAENRRRERLGLRVAKMPSQWVDRPVINEAEMALFHGFVEFAAFCGGEVDPAKASYWFDLQGVASEDRAWMGKLYSILAPTLRERDEE